MKNLLNALFNHERYQTIAVMLCAAMLIWMFSCQPKAHSILDPTKRITRTELNGEVELLTARIDNEMLSLERQEAIRMLLLNLASTYATTGAFNPMSALTGALALFSTGVFIDNSRKRKDIKKLSPA